MKTGRRTLEELFHRPIRLSDRIAVIAGTREIGIRKRNSPMRLIP